MNKWQQEELKKVLCACGTAIATSTVVAKKVEALCKEHGIKVIVDQCKASEAVSRIPTFKPDLIVGSTYIPGDLQGVPLVMGTAFLSGIKLADVKAKIIEILKD